MKRLLFLSFFLLPLVVARTPHPAFAQQVNSSISISPLIMEIEMENVQSYLKTIKVKNTNAVPYQITFEAFDVEIDPSTHNVKLLPATSKQNHAKSLASWMIPSGESTFVLQPKEEKIFEFQISAPVEALPGDYYGSVNFYYVPAESVKNGGIAIRQSLGCLLLVSLLGENPAMDQQPYDIAQVELQRGIQETEVSLQISNNTLRYVQVRPFLSIRDEKGEVFFQKNGASKRVFPGETTFVTDSFPSVYAAGEQMTLEYALWDRQKKLKLYEETIPLEVFRGAPLPYFTGLRTGLQVAGGILLGVIIYLFVRKHRLNTLKASLPNKQARRKKKGA